MSPRRFSTQLRFSALLLAAACGKPSIEKLPDAPPGSIVVHEESMIVRRGAIGQEVNVPGTYVLVDLENKTAEDRVVSADGVLQDVNGKDLAPLGTDEVRIPGGQRRTLALVSLETLPEAVGAKVNVKGSPAVGYADPLVIEDQAQTVENGAVVVRAKVRNTTKGQAEAMILCSFYDKDGHLLGRQHDRKRIATGDPTAVTFTLPPETARAVVYPGEALF